MSEIQLIPASHPIAQDAIAVRDRHPGRRLIRYPGDRLGSVSVEEAYIYPRVGGPMTPGEILQTLVDLSNRPAAAPVRPSVIRLRDGTTLTALITGFNLQLPGSLTIQTLDPSSNRKRQIAVEDVVNIQP
jgi:hypothetical protein